MQTLTQELKTFIKEKNSESLIYDDVLKEIGLTNCKNISNSTIQINSNEILFTEANIKEFCRKYNLIYGKLDKYIEKIPEKNIIDIKDYLTKYPSKNFIKLYRDYSENLILDEYSIEEIKNNFRKSFFSFGWDNINHFYHEGTLKFNGKKYKGILSIIPAQYRERNFIIVAPKNHFNLENSEIKDHQIIPDDPAIFEDLRDNKYRLVTSWGKEASAVELQNPLLN